MYSQFTPDGGPLALEVIFKNQKNNFSLVGKPKKAKQQPLTMIFFEVDETYFKDKAQIQQLLRVTNAETSKIEAELNYQVVRMFVSI
jgi:thiol:disulfide interchange protein DsbD